MKKLKIAETANEAADIISTGKRVLKIESDSISAMISRIDETFARVVDLIDCCSSHIIVTGMGKSGIIGKKIASTFSSIGKPALFLHAAEGSHGDVGLISRGDVVIAISNSGETEEILRLLPTFSRVNTSLVALTGNPKSTLARQSDYVLNVGVKEEACSLNLVPTASTTAALAMGDALALALLEKRGFKEEDFAQNHPGGSLGRKLLTTVKDLMHTGSAIPKVYENSKVYDVITEISRKGFGTTLVVDQEERIKGIITDGDLRRFIETRKDVSLAEAGEIMNPNPKFIKKENMATKAVQIMEAHSITALIVSDDKEHIEGIIHLHDLLKTGIV